MIAGLVLVLTWVGLPLALVSLPFLVAGRCRSWRRVLMGALGYVVVVPASLLGTYVMTSLCVPVQEMRCGSAGLVVGGTLLAGFVINLVGAVVLHLWLAPPRFMRADYY